MTNFKELYKEETGMNAIDRIQLYAGDRGGPEVFTEDYVEWLEKLLILNMELARNGNGNLRVSVVEPKNNQEIIYSKWFNTEQHIVTYIGDGEALTQEGEIVKVSIYKQYEK